jgi:hypothetical protein
MLACPSGKVTLKPNSHTVLKAWGKENFSQLDLPLVTLHMLWWTLVPPHIGKLGQDKQTVSILLCGISLSPFFHLLCRSVIVSDALSLLLHIPLQSIFVILTQLCYLTCI